MICLVEPIQRRARFQVVRHQSWDAVKIKFFVWKLQWVHASSARHHQISNGNHWGGTHFNIPPTPHPRAISSSSARGSTNISPRRPVLHLFIHHFLAAVDAQVAIGLNVGLGHAKALRGAGGARVRCRGAAPSGSARRAGCFWRALLLIAARACPVGWRPKGLTPAGGWRLSSGSSRRPCMS